MIYVLMLLIPDRYTLIFPPPLSPTILRMVSTIDTPLHIHAGTIHSHVLSPIIKYEDF